jgi:hypothetical protein
MSMRFGGFNPQEFPLIEPTGDNSGVGDTRLLQAALTSKVPIGLTPGGIYYINTALQVPQSGATIVGPGFNDAFIHQVNSAANGISGVDVSNVELSGFSLLGPASGTGKGVSLTRSVNPNIPYCKLDALQLATFGGAGFYADTMIVSALTGCVARSNGGDGFQLNSTTGNTTSCTLDSCFANANAGSGYELDSAVYCALNGCAADNNLFGGYALYGNNACSLNGCGSESNTGAANILLSGGIGNIINGLWINNNTTIGVSLASGEVFATLNGCVEHSATAATAFIQTAAGTSCVVTNDKHTTANVFSAGTAYEILPTGGTAH